MGRVTIVPALRLRVPSGNTAKGGVTHAIRELDRNTTVCGFKVRLTWPDTESYISCRTCLRCLGYEPPEPISTDEFSALAREMGIDMHHWYASIQDEAFDNAGMPWVHYPDGTYDRLLDALARVV